MEPKIRLKGFSGEWETHTLSQIATMHARIGWQNLRKDEFLSKGDYYLITGTDFVDGSIDYQTCHYVEEDRYNQDKNIQLKEGSILITKDGTLGKVAYVKKLDKPATLNAGVFNVVCKKDDTDSRFLFQYLKSPRLMNYVDSTATGGTIKHLNQNILVNFPVSFPAVDEQKFIGSYFQHLDSLIQSTTKKIESLKQVKVASLQSMFPQEGETTPRVRFKGFEGEWEKVAIKDIASFSKGRGYSKSDLQEVGTPIILYGRMYTKYEVCISNVDTYATFVPNSVLSNGDEVIMPASGETPEDISIASAILSKGIILGGDLNVMRFDTKKNNTTFIALSLSVGKAKKDLSNMAQGKSVVHIHNSDIEKISIPMPSFDEQQKISDYFTNLDSQITLQSQRLEKLKQIKSACLDNMFV